MTRAKLLLALLTVALSAQVNPNLELRKPFPLLERPFEPIKPGVFRPEGTLSIGDVYQPTCAPNVEITRWVGSKATFDRIERPVDGSHPYFATLGWPSAMASDGNSRVWFVEAADFTVRMATTGGIHTVAYPYWVKGHSGGALLPGTVTAMAYDERRRALFIGLDNYGIRSINGTAITGWLEANGSQDGQIWAGGTASVSSVQALASDSAQDRLFILDNGAIRVLDLLPGNLSTLSTQVLVPSPDGRYSYQMLPRLLAWNAWTNELILASDREVVAFSLATKAVRLLLGPGTNPGTQGTLKGMTVDACGRVIVSEFDTGRILEVDPRAGQAVVRELGPFRPTTVDTEPKIEFPYALVPMYDGVILGDWSSRTLRLIR